MTAPDFATAPLYELWTRVDAPDPVGWSLIATYTDHDWAVLNAGGWPGQSRAVIRVDPDDGTRSQVFYTDNAPEADPGE